MLVFVFNFDLFKFSAAILEKGLLGTNMSAHLSALQGSGVRHSHACQSSRVTLLIQV